MFLFDKSDEEILIYRMKPNLGRIKEYRKNHINYDKKIFEVSTNDKKAPFNFEELQSRPFTDFSLDEVCYKRRGLSLAYHDISEIAYSSYPQYHSIDPIENYCNGGYDNAALVRIYRQNAELKRLEFVRYLLINSDYIYESEHSRFKSIDKIVGITEEAFILELLKRGHFSLLGNADISEQIELFDFTIDPLTGVSEEEFLFYESCGLMKKNNYVQKKIDDSQKVLKYARRQGLIK